MSRKDVEGRSVTSGLELVGLGGQSWRVQVYKRLHPLYYLPYRRYYDKTPSQGYIMSNTSPSQRVAVDPYRE